MSLLAGRCLSRLVRCHPLQICNRLLCVEGEGEASRAPKKKKTFEIRVNLINGNDLNVLSLDSAKKLAARRGLDLSEVENPTKWMLVGNRPAYQLLDPRATVLRADLSSDVKELGFKGTKQLILRPRIQEHDFNVKLNQALKWFSSNYVVQIVIRHDNENEAVKELLSQIEKKIKNFAKLPGKVKKNSHSISSVEFEPLEETVKEDKENHGTS